MARRERFKVEELGGDCCDFEEGVATVDAFALLDPADYPEDQQELVTEFNRRAEQGNRIHRMACYREDMFAKGFDAGMYVCTFDRDENMTGFSFTDETRRMLGYDGTDDLPDEFESWVKTLVPEEREVMQEVFWQTVRGHRQLPDISHAEYRMVRKDGRVIWVTGAGRFIRRDDGSLEAYMGCYREVTAEHEREEYLNISQAVGRIFNFCLYIDLSDNSYRTVSTNEYVEMAPKDPDAFKFLRNNVDTTVDPSHREGLNAWLRRDTVLAGLETRDMVTRDFRSAEADRWYRATFMAGERDASGELTHVVYGCQDITESKLEELSRVKSAKAHQEQLEEATAEQEAQVEEISALNQELEESQAKLEEIAAEQEAQIEEISALNQELEASRDGITEAYDIVEGLSQEYHTIWVVSKETSRMRLVRSSGVSTIQGAVQMGLDMPAFDEAFDAYIETYVEPQDRERMHRQIAFAEILRQLEEHPKDLYTVNYLRRDEEGNAAYHQMAFVNAGTKSGHRRLVYGFRDIDAAMREEMAKRRELQEAYDAAERHLAEVDYLNKELADQNDIAASAGLGMWHIILKEGCAPRMAANWKMLEILGIPGRDDMSEEDVYSWWWDHITPDAIPSVNASVSEMLEGKFSENTYLWEHPEKGLIYTRCGGTCVTLEDGTHVVSGYHGDVTDLVYAEQEQKRQLAEARDAANAANDAKTSFLFNMSHDIRTPMNAIIGFADLLEKHQEDPERRADYLRKIQESSTVLLSIINNVLEMARIEKGTLEVDEAAWGADQFNDTLYSVFVDMMREKDIEFTRQIEVEHPYVYCDPIKLREVFINLLSNAYKYTEPGGRVNMRVEEIASDRPGYILYRTAISDTGIGMSTEFLPRLFEEFSREHTTTESEVEGTGLGMPIVKRLVDLMEGTIEVESELGVGTTFTVTIPHRIAERSALEEREGVVVDPALFKGKRILLVEDNDLNAEIAMEILGEAGFEVERSEDGDVAVRTLGDSEPGRYDAVLMDIQMPRMNGYEATRVIRGMEDPAKAGVPILAMTANAFEEDKRHAAEAGMDGHVAKPIDVGELMKALAGVLG